VIATQLGARPADEGRSLASTGDDMPNRKVEVVLVLAAAGLLGWGMFRAAGRGEPAVKAWTSCAMIGLTVLCALNVFARWSAIAVACTAASAIFVALVVLAGLLGAEQANPNRMAAMLRALVFFVLVGIASLMQVMSSRAPGASG
jgi:hypothetical protein